MRRIFVAAFAAMLAVVLSACGASDIVEGRKYYSSDERKNVMTGPFDTFAMQVQSAMQSGRLGETVSYILPEQGYFPLTCVAGGTPAPKGYAGQVQVCTADRMYILSGVTTDSPRFAEGKVFTIRASDVDAKKDSKDGIISGSYREGTKLITTNPIGTQAEIESSDAQLIRVFRSRPATFK